MRRANRTLNRVKSPEGLAAVRRWMLAHAGPYSEQGGAATIKPHSANLKCTGVETFELWWLARNSPSLIQHESTWNGLWGIHTWDGALAPHFQQLAESILWANIMRSAQFDIIPSCIEALLLPRVAHLLWCPKEIYYLINPAGLACQSPSPVNPLRQVLLHAAPPAPNHSVLQNDRAFHESAPFLHPIIL